MQKGKYLLLFLLFFIKFAPVLAQTPGNFPASLKDLFELADKNSRFLKIADFNERISAEQVKDEKKKLLPSIDASLSASYLGDGWMTNRNFSNGRKAPIPDFGNNFALEATQIIYAGGAIKSSIEIAKLHHVFAQLDKEKNKQDIRFAIAGYYLELIKLENQKKILEQNIIQANKLLEQIRAKYQQGTSLKNNLTRFELHLQSLELALLRMENNKTIINNELVETLQLPKGTIIEANGAVPPHKINAINDTSWQDLAEENSPLLEQLHIRGEQSKHQEILARSEKLPQVFAFAGDKLDGPITIEIPPINKNLNYWYAGVCIKYNIGSLYKKDNKLKIARLATQKVAENNSLVKEQLAREIDAASIRYMETLKVYNTQLKAVALATENYTVIKNRYVNGLVVITEMLDAENAKLDAELQAANAEINIIFHYYQLKKLSGTL